MMQNILMGLFNMSRKKQKNKNKVLKIEKSQNLKVNKTIDSGNLEIVNILTFLRLKFPFLFTLQTKEILSFILILFGSVFLLGSVILIGFSIYFNISEYIFMGVLDSIVSISSIYSGYSLRKQIKKLKNERKK